MRRIWITLLILGFFCCPGIARGEQVNLAPSTSITVTDPLNSGNEATWVRFDLPEALAGSRIVRATLWQGVRCTGGNGIVVWGHPSPTNWDPVSATWKSLGEAPFLEPKEIAHSETGDCEAGVAVFEVSRWVRAWAGGQRPNFGFVLRRPPEATDTFTFEGTPTCPSPYLKITYREARTPSVQK